MAVCPKCRSRGDSVGVLCDRDGFFYVDDADLDGAEDDPILGRYLGDRFAVMRALGDGGMGRVYEGVQYPVGRRVAVKVLKATLQDNARFLARFHREAQAIAHLNHPNIVTLFDFGSDDDGTNYIAMEYVEGQSLVRYLRQGVEPGFVVHVMRQVLAALQAAHDQGVVHRDLKPDNVMLTTVGGDDTFVKVLDFGLAHLASESEDLAITAAGEVFGTPLYMSPEQATSEEVSARTDLYSLGCIAYELLSGVPPFTGSRPMNVLMKHVNAPVPKLQPKPGVSVSPALEHFIMRCLEKNPNDRFPSAEAALDALYQTPEGSMAMPSLTRSLEALGRVEASRQSGVPTTGGAGELALGGELALTSPAAHAGRGKPLARQPWWHDRKLLLAAGGGAVAVLLALILIVALSRGGDVDAGAAAESDPGPSAVMVDAGSVLAIASAQARTAAAMRDAAVQVRVQFVFRHFEAALSDPGKARPGKSIKVRKPLSGEPWYEQVEGYHLKRAQAIAYTDPVLLVLGL